MFYFQSDSGGVDGLWRPVVKSISFHGMLRRKRGKVTSNWTQKSTWSSLWNNMLDLCWILYFPKYSAGMVRAAANLLTIFVENASVTVSSINLRSASLAHLCEQLSVLLHLYKCTWEAKYHSFAHLLRCNTPSTPKVTQWYWLEMMGGGGGVRGGRRRTLLFPNLASVGFTSPDLARFYSVYEAHLEFSYLRPPF